MYSSEAAELFWLDVFDIGFMDHSLFQVAGGD
jgi:hypothetical protein